MFTLTQISNLTSKPISSFEQLLSGLIIFDCLVQLDGKFFSVWGKDMFKNVEDLNKTQFSSASMNNWNIIFKAFQNYLDKENFTDSYFEPKIDELLAGDKQAFFFFLVSFISIMLMKKRYLWNQSIGLVSNSDSYNYLKELESTLTVAPEPEKDDKQIQKQKDADRDENQTLVNMVSDLQKSLKDENEKSSKLKSSFDSKKEEVDEIRKLLDQKSFDFEKMKIKVDALELSQKEYYEAMAVQGDHNKQTEQIKRLEKREEELEMENSYQRDKIAEQDKKIKELREIEGKFLAEESMRKKFDMVLERNDALNVEARKKDLEIENLRYQVEILKKSKEALEAALSKSKNENISLEHQLISKTEDIRSKDQDIANLERVIVKLKENLELNMMQNMSSPLAKTKSSFCLNLRKPRAQLRQA